VSKLLTPFANVNRCASTPGAPRAVGTSVGNTLLRRYLQNTKWVRESTSAEEMKKFETLQAPFQKYAGQYDFDHQMIMAQGYQESS